LDGNGILITPLNLLLRLAIWFLLTSDLGLANIIIGVTIALILPGGRPSRESIKDWLKTLAKVIVAIPVAYAEAIEIMFRPHKKEEITKERVKSRRTPGLIFLEIFLITFTPKTIVVKYDQEGWYKVHRIKR
jgi:multicomponent Na+:H+ antiporter subunit E